MTISATAPMPASTRPVPISAGMGQIAATTLPPTISPSPTPTTTRAPNRRPSSPPGRATTIPGSMNNPISVPSAAKSRWYRATSSGPSEATVWNWKPKPIRAKVSAATNPPSLSHRDPMRPRYGTRRAAERFTSAGLPPM